MRIPLALWLYGLLTLLVWGLFACDRGFWQDDAVLLDYALRVGPFHVGGIMPTRVLILFPSAIAGLTPSPIVFLQLAYGATWLGLAWMADRLARALFPGRPEVWLTAGCLAATATGDLLTNSLVALAYNLSLLAFLGGALWLLAWCRDGRRRYLAGSCLLLSASVWMTDGALTSLFLVPALAALVCGKTQPRRVRVGAGAWAVTATPYLAVLVHSALDASDYFQRAVVHDPLVARIARAGALFAYNFEPWTWASREPLWFGERLPAAIPVGIFVAASAAGVLLFVLVARRVSRDAGRTEAPPLRWTVVAGLAVLALAVNAAFANVQLAELHYRTQLVSRIWASLFIAAAVAPFGAGGWVRRLRMGLVGALVGLGVWAGVERQDYFLVQWWRHRAELASILVAVPRLAPRAALVLYMPASERAGYQATEEAYLAASWARLLYGPEDGERVYRCAEWDAGRCRIKGADFLYRFDEPRPRRHTYPLGDVVIPQYSHARNAYELLAEPPPALRAADAAMDRYRPAENIEAGEARPLARVLLAGDRGLARLLPR